MKRVAFHIDRIEDDPHGMYSAVLCFSKQQHKCCYSSINLSQETQRGRYVFQLFSSWLSGWLAIGLAGYRVGWLSG
jgi:hypothetical protein